MVIVSHFHIIYCVGLHQIDSYHRIRTTDARVCCVDPIFVILVATLFVIIVITSGYSRNDLLVLFGEGIFAIISTLNSLAISDMCSLITLIFTSILFTLMFTTADLSFDALAVFSLVAGHPHIAFTRLSSWITALITLERCLCIVAPLKIKNIITSRRVCIIIVSTYIILLFSEAPVYAVNRLDMIFVPERNKTLLGLVSTADRESVEMISLIINNFIIPFSACVVVIICTIILVISLWKTSKWRKTSMKSDDISNRNRRVAKMVTMISALFISCFVPDVIIMLSLAFVPDLKIGGSFMNTSIVACGVGLILESINSSVNIFIYYHMSSKYRNTFKTIFSRVTTDVEIDEKMRMKYHSLVAV